MSCIVDVATEGIRVPLARWRAAAIARAVLRAEGVDSARLSVTFVTTPRIIALNRTHLRRRGATDVIAFGFVRRAVSEPVVGDIYIAPDVARRNAVENGVSMREELARLVVHGVLHTLGFDHPDGVARMGSAMWRRQEALLRRMTRRVGGERRHRARAA
jgi:probable rRNA maturation factor